ncbi:MAG: sn-glycerol-3-phosphate ABC transporter ATP-binding protein UgpC [Deltaproteobacteria bacterium]|nr:sn-glycerol-3-phosphate ABC transporter ATP-binding protein UgpC [Deltaproteobacteria bacterium]
MTTVSLKNVVKRYDKTEVVHGINLEIEDSEFIVLVGPSGCGKSTILRMVAGLEEISDGTIMFGDRIINNTSPKDRNVAMVFQNYALYPHMNVYQNMSFGLKMGKKSKKEIAKRVEKAAGILNIQNLFKRKPGQLSGGQRQRVAMGRAIVRNPDLFLFDEPLSNLDAKLRNKMRVEIKELHQRVKNTIIYVTHDQVEAMTLGDRIVVLRAGHIEQVGSAMELYRNPLNVFVAGFIGNPPMNLVNAQAVKEGGKIKICLSKNWLIEAPAGAISKLKPGQKLVVGLRPDDVILKGLENGSLDNAAQGVVEVIEPLGSEIHVHLNIDGVKITGKCEGSRDITAGERVTMACNMDKLHLFDAKTENVVK